MVVVLPLKSVRAILNENGKSVLSRDHVYVNDRQNLHFKWTTGHARSISLRDHPLHDQGRI